MHGRPPTRRTAGSLTGLLVAVLATWNNLLVPRLGDRPGRYAAVNGAATAVLLAAARASGLSAAELDGARARAGLRRGAGPSLVLAAGYATALAVPALRPLLRDARVAELDRRAVVRRALVGIPVGTVLWEEVAFRGVLRAALARTLSPRQAAVAAPALFAVWHVRPALDAVTTNSPRATPGRRAGAVLAACAGTAAADVLFAELRRRSGSLVAPALLHLTANVGGLLAAAAAARLDGQAGTGERAPIAVGVRSSAMP
ncbi:hypothetical protein GCM10010531_12980 [Blastococcus jejuensis]|uniref:CAAX prenyl protease 2/Lysostaphin resistance protein A-like domain-containing protein n=1 Tax=Blastococcus jejuensis TaxID=351224 RepID=A0ABP6P178_9ACTN